MNNIASLGSYFILCIVKFLFAPSFAYSSLYNFSLIKTLSLTSLSGIISVIFFTFLSEKLLYLWKLVYSKIPFLPERKPKKVFSKKSRSISKIKTRWGLWGLIIISPLFPSIPIGTFIIVKYFGIERRTIILQSISAIVWAIITSFFFFYTYSFVENGM
jgi:hypothetical protein